MTKNIGESQLSRRAFVGRSALTVGGLMASPTIATLLQASAARAAGAGETSVFGVPYPADAAPVANQFVQTAANPTGKSWKTMDFYESVYSRAEGAFSDHFSEGLVRVDKDWQLLPGQASDWVVSADGLSWTFHLDEGLMWSNGDEVTADDYVASFRYSADPAHAWDFTWYWDGIIKNYGKAFRGDLPVTDIGVKVGANKYEVVFETEQPTPFLPKMLLYSQPLHAKSLAEYGSGIYNMDPATAVSNSPYLLEEYSPDRRVTVTANLKYTGRLRPLTNRLVANVVTGGSDLARYEAGEIDFIASLSAGDLKTVLADPALKDQVKVSPGDFRTYYMFFDVTTAPFDNRSVRLAIAKSVDRVGIIEGILAPVALPSYSFLMPGFPDSNAEALKPIQDYDPDEARRLLGEAGFPNGEGFPRVTLMVRGSGPNDPVVSQAVAASISQTLGIQFDLQTLDQSAFMEDLNAKPTKILWGWISYGMDWLDATNMLGVFKSGGRHNWNNAEFDRLVNEGGQITDDLERRSQMMMDAERMLVEDAPAAFVYHPLVPQLHKPYRKGDFLLANKSGYTGAQWPGESMFTESYNSLYQGLEVLEMRKA